MDYLSGVVVFYDKKVFATLVGDLVSRGYLDALSCQFNNVDPTKAAIDIDNMVLLFDDLRLNVKDNSWAFISQIESFFLGTREGWEGMLLVKANGQTIITPEIHHLIKVTELAQHYQINTDLDYSDELVPKVWERLIVDYEYLLHFKHRENSIRFIMNDQLGFSTKFL